MKARWAIAFLALASTLISAGCMVRADEDSATVKPAEVTVHE
jgi:hypothetical protein